MFFGGSGLLVVDDEADLELLLGEGALDSCNFSFELLALVSEDVKYLVVVGEVPVELASVHLLLDSLFVGEKILHIQLFYIFLLLTYFELELVFLIFAVSKIF